MTSEKNLYEILVPCQWNDGTPVRMRHHKAWDEKVRAVSGGLTIYQPAKGQWEHEGELFAERMIPVRVLASPEDMAKIVYITMVHYENLLFWHTSFPFSLPLFMLLRNKKMRFSRERNKQHD